jgi:hypothetical protein
VPASYVLLGRTEDGAERVLEGLRRGDLPPLLTHGF